MKKTIKLISVPILTSVIVIFISFIGLNRINQLNSKNAVYKETNYDFMVTTTSQEQVNELVSHTHVEKYIGFYNFSLLVNSKKQANFLFARDFNNINLSIYSEMLLVEGELNKNKVLVDTIFARKHNLKIGDSINTSLNGNQIFLEISGIFLPSDITLNPSSEGTVIAEWISSYDSFFQVDLTYDLVFVTTNNYEILKSFLNNNYSFINRLERLEEELGINNRNINKSLTSILITNIASILVNVIVFVYFLLSDTDKIKTNIRENNKKENKVYIKYNLYSLITMLFVHVIFSMIAVLNFVVFDNLVLFLLYTLIYYAILVVSLVLINNIYLNKINRQVKIIKSDRVSK